MQKQLAGDKQAIDQCLRPIITQQSAEAQLQMMPQPPKAKRPQPKFIGRLMAQAASLLRAALGGPRITQGEAPVVQAPAAYNLQPSSSASQTGSSHPTPRNTPRTTPRTTTASTAQPTPCPTPRPSSRGKHARSGHPRLASHSTRSATPRPLSGVTSATTNPSPRTAVPPTPAETDVDRRPSSADSVPEIPSLDVRAAYWAKSSLPGSMLSDLSTPAERPSVHPFSSEERSHAAHRGDLTASAASLSTAAVPRAPVTTGSPEDQHSPDAGPDSVALAQPPKMQDNLAFRTDSDLGADTIGVDTITPRPTLQAVSLRAPVSGDTGTPVTAPPRSPPVSECSAAFSDHLSRPASGVIPSESELDDQPGPMLTPSSYPEVRCASFLPATHTTPMCSGS